MQRTYNGECPYTNESRSISVDYNYVPIIGTDSLSYKKMLFDCSLGGECPDPNNCPIYASAPNSITV